MANRSGEYESLLERFLKPKTQPRRDGRDTVMELLAEQARTPRKAR